MVLQDEAKKLLPLVQALVEGKGVLYDWANRKGVKVKSLADLLSNSGDVEPTARVKPEPTYRPFKSNEVLLVGKVVQFKNNRDVKHLITSQGEQAVAIGDRSMSYEGLLASYEFLDGSPCGILEGSP